MQNINVGEFELHSLQADFELNLHIGRRAVGRVGALCDDNDLIAHAALFDPLPQQPLVVSAAVNVRGVERVAASLEKVVEHDGRVGKTRLIVAAENQARDPFFQAVDAAILHLLIRPRRKRPALNGRVAKTCRLLGFIGQSDRLAPTIKRAHVPQRIGPGHRRRRCLPRAGEQGASERVGFIGV